MCAVDWLNLLWKDWRQKQWAHDIVDKLKNVVEYIQALPCFTLVVFIYSSNLGLKMLESTKLQNKS